MYKHHSFSETDITSDLTPLVKVKMRTGFLSPRELKVLQDGLESEQVRGAVTWDPDFGVDEESERSHLG